VDDLRQRGIKHLQEIYPRAPVLSKTVQLVERETGTVEKPIHLHVAYDPFAAIKQALIAIPTLGSHGELHAIVADFPNLLNELKSSVGIGGGNELRALA